MKDDNELLRQIHPNFIQNGRVSSQAFKPMPKDEQQLSVYDGNQVDAEGAYQHYTDVLNLFSEGVMAVTVGECEELDLRVRPDPQPYPEHTVIDFSTLSGSAIERKAKKLRAKAARRDWLYKVTC